MPILTFNRETEVVVLWAKLLLDQKIKSRVNFLNSTCFLLPKKYESIHKTLFSFVWTRKSSIKTLITVKNKQPE